ncbi:MAG: hypothetical protein ACRD3G_25145 [Vicinamibacterales bacterium]
MMRSRAYCAAACLLVFVGHAVPAAAQVDQQRAQEYFNEVQVLCERDGGRLWGVSLCAPMVIGDMRTRTFATSQPAPEGARPQLVGLVNAPIQWGGVTWGAYAWDFVIDDTPRGRRELMLHELFHAIQPQLGLLVPAPASEHLDSVDGRYWMRLEWRALARALRESGEQRALAIGAQEITEGLAAYTATVVAAESAADALASAVDQLTKAETQESFVRTFAYASGPAYGLLLDASSAGWTRRVRGSDDLAALVMRTVAVQTATDVTRSAARYGGVELRALEQRRRQQRDERVAELRLQFVDGPMLRIPGAGSGSFDARGAVVIPGIGTVYFGAYRFSGDWGALAAEQGVLVESDGGARRVPAPVRRDDTTVAGNGWTFTAKPGWVIREGARRGDYEVIRQQP